MIAFILLRIQVLLDTLVNCFSCLLNIFFALWLKKKKEQQQRFNGYINQTHILCFIQIYAYIQIYNNRML